MGLIDDDFFEIESYCKKDSHAGLTDPGSISDSDSLVVYDRNRNLCRH